MTSAEAADAAVDELVIFASPRSGTNYFCESLKSFGEISAFYELFNPAAAMGVGPKIIPFLNDLLGLNAEKATDYEVRQMFRGQPLVALDALGRTAGERGASMISYKVFPRQLPKETLEALIASERRHPLFIVRGRLDVYVSLVKARATNSYKNTSTVDILPKIGLQDFLEWAEHTDDFYRFCFDTARAHGKKLVVLRYEADIDLPRAELLPRVQRALALLDLEVELPERISPVRFERQDRRVTPFEKISNGEDLRAELRAMGKYDFALAAPLEEEASDLSDRPKPIAAAAPWQPWRRLVALAGRRSVSAHTPDQ